MAERSASEAVEAYRQPLQRVLSCVTNRILVASVAGYGDPRDPAFNPHGLALAEGSFVPLSSASAIALRVNFRYEIIPVPEERRRWYCRTTEYSFSLAMQESDQPVELITYHWQPEVREGKAFPHLHIGPAIAGTSLTFGTQFVHRMHVPTGIVSLSSVIRLAIEELDVRPLRDDWQQVLNEHAES